MSIIYTLVYCTHPCTPARIYVLVNFSIQKYIDIFAGTLGFWLFGYAISANTDHAIAGEEQDFIFWFFRVRPEALTHIHYQGV